MPGYNFRLSDVNCTLGISQLKQLDKLVRSRRRIAKIYMKIKVINKLSCFTKSKNEQICFSSFYCKFKIKKTQNKYRSSYSAFIQK